ncbi:MAG: hypothetical protein NT149_02730 [Candidatus Gottesmanbacteria bacterium]|nr:hypothetical protein [Candidatus Gottesmanbacteria bacterium]
MRLGMMFVSQANYDIQSYQIVGKLASEGKNVYEMTSRYNYGPIWFLILGVVYKVSLLFQDQLTAFRLCITIIISIVDVCIAFSLWKIYSKWIAILFILNPISIILTGTHGQFDNLAILVALWAAYLYQNAGYKWNDRNRIIGLILLGISVVIKHIFILLPFWWLLKSKNWKSRLVLVAIPFGIFLVSFVPWIRAYHSIFTNVFLYRSEEDAVLYHMMLPYQLQVYITKYVFFYIMIALCGIYARRLKILDSLLFYTLAFVVFSYAVANQYFAIPLVFVSAYLSIFGTAYSIVFMLNNLPPIFGFISPFSFSSLYVLLFTVITYYVIRHSKYFIRKNMLLSVLFTIVITFILIWYPPKAEELTINPIRDAIHANNYDKAVMLLSKSPKLPAQIENRYYQEIIPYVQELKYYKLYKQASALLNSNKLNSEQIKSMISTIPHTVGFYDDVKRLMNEMGNIHTD